MGKANISGKKVSALISRSKQTLSITKQNRDRVIQPETAIPKVPSERKSMSETGQPAPPVTTSAITLVTDSQEIQIICSSSALEMMSQRHVWSRSFRSRPKIPWLPTELWMYKSTSSVSTGSTNVWDPCKFLQFVQQQISPEG